MANLSFMSTLTDQQRQYAEVIRQRAQEMGIPPDLAVAVAFQESRLNPASKDSEAGAIGIMQVRPIAARDVGMNPEDLRDPSANIDAGLKYLKKALTETQDPRLAIIYYNAGPQTLQRFDQGGDLPQETENYLKSLHAYGAFRPATAETAPQAPGGYDIPPELPAPQQTEGGQALVNEDEKRIAQYVGFGVGGAESVLRTHGKSLIGRFGAPPRAAPGAPGPAAGAPGAAGAPSTPPAAGAAPVGAPAGLPGAPGGQPGPAGAPMARPGVGGPAGPVGGPVGAPAGTMPTMSQSERVRLGNVDQGTTGLQRMRFNEQTAQQAARAKAAEQMFGQMARQGAVPMTTSQVLAGMPDLTSTSGGILVPTQSVQQPMAPQGPQSPLERLQKAQEAQRAARAGQAAQSVGRRPGPLGPAVTPPPPVQGGIPAPARPSGLDQITQMFSQAARSGLQAIKPTLAFGQRYIAPPLALAQGAGELVSAKQSMKQGDPLGAALRGLGGAGAVASMFTPAALPVAVGAPLTQAFRQRMTENAQRFPPDTRPLSPEEEAIASRPAFVYPRAAPRRPTLY